LRPEWVRPENTVVCPGKRVRPENPGAAVLSGKAKKQPAYEGDSIHRLFIVKGIVFHLFRDVMDVGPSGRHQPKEPASAQVAG
jgi:hypothetical protein